MKLLIDKDTVSLMSAPFELTRQVTVYAYSLEDEDTVTFELVSLTKPFKADCQCPPGQVVYPSVDDAMPPTCCSTAITLSRAQPWVIIDAPQGAYIRALLHAAAVSAQSVQMEDTNVPNVTERMRGCACGD